MTEISDITSWDNPMMQYWVRRLRLVHKFNLRPEIQFPDEEGGKPDYVSRLLKILAVPDGSGDVEALNAAIKYLKNLTKEERIEFVANMRMFANAGRGIIPSGKTFTFLGKECLDRVVKAHATGAHVGVPKSWIGKPVAVVLLAAQPQGNGANEE